MKPVRAICDRCVREIVGEIQSDHSLRVVYKHATEIIERIKEGKCGLNLSVVNGVLQLSPYYGAEAEGVPPECRYITEQAVSQ